MAIRTAQTDDQGLLGLLTFMGTVLTSYLLVFLVGMITAWFCLGRRPHRSRIEEVMVIEPAKRPKRTGPTLKTTEKTIVECCKQMHNTRSGRNPSSVYITCFHCGPHCLWLKDDSPTFQKYPSIRFMQISWNEL